MPAAVIGACCTILGSVLVFLDRIPPYFADQFRVNEDIDLLTMEERLGVEISVSCAPRLENNERGKGIAVFFIIILTLDCNLLINNHKFDMTAPLLE